jgi:hypothetical protein
MKTQTTQQAPTTYPTTVYQRKTEVPPSFVAVPVASAAELHALGGAVYLTAEDAASGLHPAQLHPEIVTYPTVVYQKSDVAPGYVAVPVASEDEVLALTGPVFLTAQNAIRYVPPPEQPIPHIARTDNFEQFVPGKSTLGVTVPVPVGRENPVPGTYVRQGLPDPPPDPPATQSADPK